MVASTLIESILHENIRYFYKPFDSYVQIISHCILKSEEEPLNLLTFFLVCTFQMDWNGTILFGNIFDSWLFFILFFS